MRKRISFCTVAMNRIDHVKATLPQNLRDNTGYTNVEFVLLDYNSNDGLIEWIHSNLGNFIEMNLLKCFRADEPRYFHRSHAKNMAAKCATGDIICNVDADNFIGCNFAEYVNNVFLTDSVFLVARDPATPDVNGRICVARNDFYALNGYDEKMKGYGWEDIDFVNRLIMLNRKQVRIKNPSYLHYIPHSDMERLSNHHYINIYGLFVCFVNTFESEFLFLFNDGHFEKIVIQDHFSIYSHDPNNVDHNVKPQFRYMIKDNNHYFSGTWTKTDDRCFLKESKGQTYRGVINEGTITFDDSEGRVFRRLTGDKRINKVIKFIDEKKNLARLKENLGNSKGVNPNGFGNGRVSNVFSSHHYNSDSLGYGKH